MEKETTYNRGSAWKEAGWVWVLSRVLVVIATFIVISNFAGGGYPVYNCPTQLQDCLSSWLFWDAKAFTDLAYHWYGYNLDATAFFPLWPLTMRMLGWVMGGSYEMVYVSGLILTSLFFYLALVLCYRLLAADFGASVSRDALFYLALAPYGIFFFAGFSEALFLLLCLAMFSFLRLMKGNARWWLAGGCGFLASLTRSTGIILLVPYAIFWLQYLYPYRRELFARWRSVLNSTLPMVLIPAGVVAYMCYLWLQFGDPMLFSTRQAEVWRRTMDWPWVGTVETIMTFVQGTGKFQRNVLDLVFTLIPIAALIIGWRRLPLYYTVFVVAMMLFSLSYPYVPEFPLGGGPRYMLVLFPIAALFAIWSKNSHLKMMFSAGSVGVFVLVTGLFVRHISI